MTNASAIDERLLDLARIAPAVAVIYVRVEDNVDGTCWPPDGDGYWTVVRRERGFTVWRGIEIGD